MREGRDLHESCATPSSHGSTGPEERFHGRIVDWRPFAFGTAIRKRHPAGQVVSEHRHESAYVTLVLQGAYRESIGGQRVECRAGDMLFHPAGSLHGDEFEDRPAVLLSIELDDSWIDSSLGRIASEAHAKTSKGLRPLMDRLWIEMHRTDQDSDLVIEALLVDLLSAHSRSASAVEPGRWPPWLPEALDLFRDRACMASVGLSAFAKEIGVHPSHLARVVRSHTGCTVGDWVRGERLRRATESLASSDESVASIAARHGFTDESHLHRVLKRAVHLSPGAYRRACRA